ncbi:hypothetical protein ACWF94_16450 [Streptomyces sp. NPDC055078]
MIDIPDTQGNVLIVPLPDSTEFRITDEDGSTAYAPEDHRGWKVLHYTQPGDDIHTSAVYDIDSTDVENDSLAAVAAITPFAASLAPGR